MLLAAKKHDADGVRSFLVSSGGDCIAMPTGILLQVLDVEKAEGYGTLIGFRLDDTPTGGEFWASSGIIQQLPIPVSSN